MTQRHQSRRQSSRAQRRLIARRRNRSGMWFQRMASTELATVDDDERTIMATIATENPVRFYDYPSRRVIREVLVVAGGRLPKWSPMLNRHMDWSLTDNLGSVLDSKVVGKVIRAQLKFATSDDVTPIWERVRDGHLREVSIGGRRLTFTDIEPGQTAEVAGRTWRAGKMPLRVTSQWSQREASVVIFGADGDASTN